MEGQMAQTAGAAAPGRPAVGKIITPEDRANLKNYHVNRILDAVIKTDEARAPLKAAQDVVTNLVNQAKGDLGKRMSRARLMRLVNARLARVRDLVQEENERAEDNIDLSLPMYGQQAELFDNKAPIEARDEIFWEAEGYQVGRRGLLNAKAPDDCPARMLPAWEKGVRKGQDETQQGFLAAQDLLKKRSEPDPKAGVGQTSDAKDTDLDAATIEGKARKLRAKGFTDSAKAKGGKSTAKSGPSLSVVGGSGAAAGAVPTAAE
jgi:hypothetical protein